MQISNANHNTTITCAWGESIGFKLAKNNVEGQAELLTDLTKLGMAMTGMCSSKGPAQAGRSCIQMCLGTAVLDAIMVWKCELELGSCLLLLLLFCMSVPDSCMHMKQTCQQDVHNTAVTQKQE